MKKSTSEDYGNDIHFFFYLSLSLAKTQDTLYSSFAFFFLFPSWARNSDELKNKNKKKTLYIAKMSSSPLLPFFFISTLYFNHWVAVHCCFIITFSKVKLMQDKIIGTRVQKKNAVFLKSAFFWIWWEIFSVRSKSRFESNYLEFLQIK